MVPVAASADETATKRTCDGEECIRREVEAKLQQEQLTMRQQTDETRTAVEDIAAKLDQLMKQLNKYRPVQETTVTAQGKRLAAGAEKRLELQSSRLDNFAQSLQETREEQHSTSDTLQTILVSMENLSDNLRRLHEETLQWRNPEQHMEDEEQGREDQAILDSLLHEVSLTQSLASETVPISAESLIEIPISTHALIL